MNQDYESYRSNKLESGLLFQDFVVDVCGQMLGLIIQQYASKAYQRTVGESRQGFEIKHDELYCQTGNLWIEVAEKARPRAGDYVPSGIYRDDNSWLYIIGDYDTLFIFAIATLRRVKETNKYPLRANKTQTSMGFCLPGDYARRLSIKQIDPKAKTEIAKCVQELEDHGRELHRLAMANPAQRSFFEAE